MICIYHNLSYVCLKCPPKKTVKFLPQIIMKTIYRKNFTDSETTLKPLKLSE